MVAVVGDWCLDFEWETRGRERSVERVPTFPAKLARSVHTSANDGAVSLWDRRWQHGMTVRIALENTRLSGFCRASQVAGLLKLSGKIVVGSMVPDPLRG